MTAQPELRRTGRLLGLISAILMGWVCVMAAYFFIYDIFERRAIPVAVTPFKDFYERWGDGYVSLAGSFASDTTDPKEELPLQTSKITCIKETKTCRIATARIFSSQVAVDDDTFDIKSWTDQLIAFDDDSGICSVQHYTINRAAQSLQITSNKKSDATEKVCQNMLDEQHITLQKGWDVYWAKVQAYEGRNELYFHLLLVAMNGAYIAVIVHFFRRRRKAKVELGH